MALRIYDSLGNDDLDECESPQGHIMRQDFREIRKISEITETSGISAWVRGTIFQFNSIQEFY